MEKKELVIPAFFGPQGLTAASANHIADMAKENYQAIEKRFSLMDFHKKTVALIGSSDETVLSYGTSKEQFAGIQEDLNEVVDLKRLIAYLREAIKAKETLAEEAAISLPKSLTDFWKTGPLKSRSLLSGR